MNSDPNVGRPKLLIWGASGHAKVVVDIVARTGVFAVAGFLDAVEPGRRGERFAGGDVLGGEEILPALRDAGVEFAFVAIGRNDARIRAGETLDRFGFTQPCLVHPQAVVGGGARLGAGTLVGPGAVVGVDAVLGRWNIVNTGASVDHDCVLGDGVHVSPGARLAGSVRVGRETWVGMGASVIDRCSLGEKVVVGAGAAVIRDVAAGCVVVGVPARLIRGTGPTFAH